MDYIDYLYDEESDIDFSDEEEKSEQGCPCGNVCMDCLGMSWSDFV